MAPRWWLWLMQADTKPRATLTLTEIDEQIRHCVSRRDRVTDPRLKVEMCGILDAWLECRFRVTETHRLEQHLNQ